MDLVAYFGTFVATVTLAVVGMLAVIRTLAARFDDVNARFDDMNRRFDGIDRRFDEFGRAVDARFDDLRADLGGRMDRIERQLESVRDG